MNPENECLRIIEEEKKFKLRHFSFNEDWIDHFYTVFYDNQKLMSPKAKYHDIKLGPIE